MKLILFIAAFIALSLTGNAQITIKGSVKDSQTGSPIEGATVVIPHTSIATTTDNRGNFILQSKRNFNQFAVSSIGYKNILYTIENKKEGLTINLVQSSGALNPVAVTGFVKAPQTAATLTESELRRFSGLNLQDALNTVPGVNMQSRTPWGGQRIIIRGYYPSADNGRSNSANFAGLGYQLFLNNIPVTDATGTTVMDDIDFADLGRVEIIKGPSPLYGSYIAGAINLFTKRPAPNQSSLSNQTIAGSYGLFRNSTTIETSNGTTDIRANYGHQSYSGFRPNDASTKDFFNLTTNFNVGENQTISTYFSYNNSYENLAGEIDSADFYARKNVSNDFYVLNNSHAAIESFRAGITDKFRITDHVNNQTTVFATGSTLNQSFAHGFTKNQNINFGGRTAFVYDASLASAQIEGIAGGMFERTNQDNHANFIPPFVSPPFTPATVPNIPSASQNNAMNYSLFTQWKLNLAQQLTVTAGVSLNFIEFSMQNLLSNGALYLDNPVLRKTFKPVLTPGISVTKAFSNAVSVYGSLAVGYGAPTISQVTRSNGTINTDLLPEKAVQYEIGIRGNPGNTKKLAYQLSLFDMEITNKLSQQTANGISFYTNVGKQKNRGAELTVSYAAINNPEQFITVLKPWVSYAYSNFKYNDFKNHGKSSSGNDTTLTDYSGRKVAAVAPNTLNLGLDVFSRNGLYLSATYKYVDKLPLTFDNEHYMKSYSLLSAKAGLRTTIGSHLGLEVFAGADNILGNTYYNFIFVGQNIQELGQGNDPFITGGGGDGYILPAPYKATFYGGINLKYNF